MLLVLCAGNAVRTERLLAELWEDCPPPSAQTTLQTYIYQLRKLFDRAIATSGSPIRLETTASGYLLRIPPDCVDVNQFEAFAAQGRRYLAEGETAFGIETLDHALALWPPGATADLDVGPVLQAEMVRLEELRRAVVEERIDAEIRRGRHHQVVGELLGLVAAYPTHEGLQAKLMLALHRSGRRSEALAAYGRARSALAAELGLEPCAELRRLHGQILAADPSLDLPAAVLDSFGPRVVPKPRQLPPSVRIVGRDSELDALCQALGGGRTGERPLVAITGMPSSGKSALCVQAAHRVLAAYPDGQLWAELITADGRPVAPAAILGDFLRAAGVPASRLPTSLEDRGRMFRSWAAHRRVLVVLDDVVALDQLLPLLPGGSGSATLVTCRRHLSDPRITAAVAAAPLSDQAARQVLADALGEARVTAETEPVDKLIQLCAGLSGPLHAAAGHLNLRPHWSVARLFRRAATLPRTACPPEPVHSALVSAVRRTYRLLDLPALAALQVLTAAGRSISAEHASRQLGITETAAETALEDLVEVQLADVHWSPREQDFSYQVRPVFRAAASALGGESDARDQIPAVSSLPVADPASLPGRPKSAIHAALTNGLTQP